MMVLWVAIRRLKSSSVGGLHLVVTEVVPVGGGAEKEKKKKEKKKEKRVLVLFSI